MLLKQIFAISTLALTVATTTHADENTFWEYKFKTGRYIEITKPLPYTNQVQVKVKELAYQTGDYKFFNTIDSYIVGANGNCLTVSKRPAEAGYPGGPDSAQQIGSACSASWDESVKTITLIIKDRTEYVWKKDLIDYTLFPKPGKAYFFFKKIPEAINLIPHS